MNRYVMEEFYGDPALRRRLFENARLERARSVQEGLAWLRRHLVPRIGLRTGWMERLG